MNLSLDILDAARAMASHATRRQSVISENIANADTPGYKARDIEPFADHYNHSADDRQMKSTRQNHFPSLAHRQTDRTVVDRATAPSPNGNSVSLEQQMTKSVELRNEYDLALAIFQKSMNILRLSIGK